MLLVLVQNPVIVNEGYEWKGIEGEQYHFPNQYKNRCATGTPFVYYRGTRRPDGKRAAPEYSGTVASAKYGATKPFQNHALRRIGHGTVASQTTRRSQAPCPQKSVANF